MKPKGDHCVLSPPQPVPRWPTNLPARWNRSRNSDEGLVAVRAQRVPCRRDAWTPESRQYAAISSRAATV